MKLLIASDLHGSARYCENLLARIDAEQPDKILLLGDLLYHGPRNDLPQGYAPKQVIPMLNGLKDKIIAVRGNCDAEVDQMVLEFPIMADYTTLVLENGRTLFATHGHLFDPDHLPPLPAGSAFAFGQFLRSVNASWRQLTKLIVVNSHRGCQVSVFADHNRSSRLKKVSS